MSIWLPWFYHYLVGGAVAGLTVYAAVRQGALRMDSRSDRRLLAALGAGLGGFALIHAVWMLGVLG